MRLSCPLLLMCCLFLQACCCADSVAHRHVCLSHPEEPFDISDRPPGPGLVFGTADFDDDGFVLIKIQVEDLASDPGDQAAITVWSGNGDRPADSSTPPAGGTQVYATAGDVKLRHWTSHLARNYDPVADSYWLMAHVDLKTGSSTRQDKYLWWAWKPSAMTGPDLPHDFNQY